MVYIIKCIVESDDVSVYKSSKKWQGYDTSSTTIPG